MEKELKNPCPSDDSNNVPETTISKVKKIMPSIINDAAGLWPGDWFLLPFISAINDFSELIPTGAMPFVRGTAMDFNNSVAVGERIGKVKGGYDHNYILKKKEGVLSMAAQLYDPRTGRQVEISTTQPGLQFYSGNFLDGTIKGKSGKQYNKYWGLCLEAQHFPDSPNHSDFPNTILKPGEKFSETTVYRFSVLK